MSKIDIDAVCGLCALTITEEHKKEFTDQLEKILDYMDVLNNVTEVANPDFEWPIHKDIVIREDNPKAFSHPLVKENAPNFKDNCFVVPKIVT